MTLSERTKEKIFLLYSAHKEKVRFFVATKIFSLGRTVAPHPLLPLSGEEIEENKWTPFHEMARLDDSDGWDKNNDTASSE
jgi:hypothetical protein